jgi:hypothetical protein
MTENIPAGWFMLATTAIITVPPTINAMVNMMLARRAEVKLDIVAAKAAIVAEKVEASTKQSTENLNITKDIHTLVNSQYGIALALIVEKASRIYEISKLEADRLELERAKEKLAEHEAKQHVVDTTAKP